MYLPDTVGCASLLKVSVRFWGIEILLAFSDTTFFLREVFWVRSYSTLVGPFL